MSRSRLEQRMGKPFDRVMDRVVARIGKDAFTRRMLRDKKFTSRHGLVRLANLVNPVYHPKSVRDLVRRMSFDDILTFAGVGFMTINALGEAMTLVGLDPNRWLDRSNADGATVSTRCLKKKEKSKGRDNVRQFRAAS